MSWPRTLSKSWESPFLVTREERQGNKDGRGGDGRRINKQRPTVKWDFFCGEDIWMNTQNHQSFRHWLSSDARRSDVAWTLIWLKWCDYLTALSSSGTSSDSVHVSSLPPEKQSHFSTQRSQTRVILLRSTILSHWIQGDALLMGAFWSTIFWKWATSKHSEAPLFTSPSSLFFLIWQQQHIPNKMLRVVINPQNSWW